MKCPKCGNKDLEEVKKLLIWKCKKCGFTSISRSFLEENEKVKTESEREYWYKHGERRRIKVERDR